MNKRQILALAAAGAVVAGCATTDTMPAMPRATMVVFVFMSSPQRLIDGALNVPPLEFFARYVVSAMDAGEMNSSSGKRCWRKQS